MQQRYQEQFRAASSLGVPATYSFRLNSLFDPNYTTTGHQPLYFDQMAALYSFYKVLRVRWRITVMADTSPCYLTCIINQSNNGSPGFNSGDLFTSAEQVGADIQSVSSLLPLSLEGTVNVHRYLNCGSKEYVGDISYDVATNANPSPTVWLTLMWVAMDGAGNSNLNATVQFDFDSVYKQLQVVSQS